MRRQLLALLAAALLGPAARAELPSTWFGDWSGTCAYGPPGDAASELGMDVSIAPDPDAPGYIWKTTYRLPGQAPQVRDYRLLPGDDGHRFVLDERNGILLDATLVGDVLFENFYLANNARNLHVRWERRGARLMVEMPTYRTRPARTSTGPGGIQVSSFPMIATQVCDLGRQ